jgi:hypothetical protein
MAARTGRPCVRGDHPLLARWYIRDLALIGWTPRHPTAPYRHGYSHDRRVQEKRPPAGGPGVSVMEWEFRGLVAIPSFRAMMGRSAEG